MRLVLRFDGQDVQEFVLDKQTISIGRTEKNDIVIDNLAVSSLHASIHSKAEGAVLEDMKSTNGTFVNDNKVSHYNLKNGDIITIGKHQIVFYSESLFNVAATEDNGEATVIMSADFQQKLQSEISKNKATVRNLKRRQDKKGFWSKLKGLFGL